MKDNLEKNLDIKILRLNNPENYVLTHNRFITYLVLIFSDLNKAQVYKMPFRVISNEEIKIVMSFDYLNVFKPSDYTEDYHITKPGDEKFLFEIEDKNYIYVGDKVVRFKTNEQTINYSPKLGHNKKKYSYAYGKENIYFMLHQKCITIQAYETSTEKDENQYLFKKVGELKDDNYENEGIFEYGNNFIYSRKRFWKIIRFQVSYLNKLFKYNWLLYI